MTKKIKKNKEKTIVEKQKILNQMIEEKKKNLKADEGMLVMYQDRVEGDLLQLGYLEGIKEKLG